MRESGHVTPALRTLVTLSLGIAGLILLPSPASAQVSARDLDVSMNVTYREIGAQILTMDIYTPRSAGPFPAVVMIHGGGFYKGDKNLNSTESANLADNGYAVFNINYRLAPEFPYPAAVEDAEAAVQWVRDHADQYRVDPARIATFGTSAGGTIAVSVAAQGAGTTGSLVMATVSWSGSLNMPLTAQLRPNNPEVQEGLSDYAGMPGQDVTSPSVQAKLAEISPDNLVHKDAPPMFIANGTSEFVPIENAQSFVSKLDQLGIPYQFLTPDCDCHALHYAGQARAPTIQWLATNLQGAPGSPTIRPSSPSTGAQTPAPTRTRQRRNREGGSSSLPLILLILAIVVIVALLVTLLALRRKPNPRPPGGF